MLAREGISTIAVVFAFSILVAVAVFFAPSWIGIVIYPALIVLCGLILWFFRDPDRSTPSGERDGGSPGAGPRAGRRTAGRGRGGAARPPRTGSATTTSPPGPCGGWRESLG